MPGDDPGDRAERAVQAEGQIAAEDAGDPAEFVEPSARGPAHRGGDPAAGPRGGGEPELPNFVGRGRDQGRASGGPGDERDPNGHGPRGAGGGASAGAAGSGRPPAGPDVPAPDADGIPPAPNLDPAPASAPGVPPPAHLRQPPGESPGGPGTSPLRSIPLRVPRLPRLPSLPGLGRRGERTPRPTRTRGLRVNQRLWRVDPWSVFKISALFYLCLFVILMVAGTLLWNVGRSSGTIDQFESFVTRLGAYGNCVPEDEVAEGTEFETDEDCPDGQVLVDGFALDDGTFLRAAAIGGVVLVVAGSVGNVLMTVLLNLINEVSGGTRYTILREPAPRPPGSPAPGAPPTPGAPPPGATPGAGPPGPPRPPRGPDGSTNAPQRR